MEQQIAKDSELKTRKDERKDVHTAKKSKVSSPVEVERPTPTYKVMAITIRSLYLRNRKHVPCFYRVIQTRVEGWENEKCCGNTSRRLVFPQLFRVLSNFLECLFNSIETRSTFFLLFLLENNATRKRKITCSLWLSKCKFSLLMPSLRQQRALVLCLNRVIQTRFLTNHRACFLRTVF